MPSVNTPVRLRRALFTASDKTGIAELASAMHATGTELVATGKTAQVLIEAGLPVTPIERISGSPEAFQGRMKTLSFPVCSGILYRRGDSKDEADLDQLGFAPIDCVVVNFYPFEKAAAMSGAQRSSSPERERKALIDEVDIGGPTLVRSAAKNAPDTLVLTDPTQYARVIRELGETQGVSRETSLHCAARAWDRVLEYDQAIQFELGGASRLALRYGENPHQRGHLDFDPDGPLDWGARLTTAELSYNNILDLSGAYALASDLLEISPQSHGVVIVKHNNPCGVATASTQLEALTRAWEGDPVSAFGGVLAFTRPLEPATLAWLGEKFVELVAAPGLTGEALAGLLKKRKNLKAVPIRRFGEIPARQTVTVPGGRLVQTPDAGLIDPLRSVTRAEFPQSRQSLARFGIAVCRSLKSNAIALVREYSGAGATGFQLVGAGQGQPNRVEALERLAVPRAEHVLGAPTGHGGHMEDLVMVSDAFFPFRDTVDAAHRAGVRAIIQPGGSIKDAESIAACDEHGISMAFTGVRHFRH